MLLPGGAVVLYSATSCAGSIPPMLLRGALVLGDEDCGYEQKVPKESYRATDLLRDVRYLAPYELPTRSLCDISAIPSMRYQCDI
eukprot:1984488-Rhodomonas_salina.1